MLNYLEFLLLFFIFYPFCNCNPISEDIDWDKISEAEIDVIKKAKDLNSTEENRINYSSILYVIKDFHKELPRNCEELMFMEGKQKNGIYKIYPQGRKNPVRVYCDMDTQGGGWTVIQRRGYFGEPNENFSRSWDDYKNGFGSLREEFWLGNDLISLLTQQERMTLRIELLLQEGYKFAEYSDFIVKGEDESYRMTYLRFRGNIGDSLGNNYKFYTFDRKKYLDDSVSVQLSGGWWTSDLSFFFGQLSNINGVHGTNEKTCILWIDDCLDKFAECKKCAKEVEMKLRPQYSIIREKDNHK